MPHDEETIAHVTAQYKRRGLPSCIGSIDCVHLCWDRCLASMHSVCKGKDNVPTLAFQVVCSHTKKYACVRFLLGHLQWQNDCTDWSIVWFVLWWWVSIEESEVAIKQETQCWREGSLWGVLDLQRRVSWMGMSCITVYTSTTRDCIVEMV
jgi:hypothetical protein